MTRYGVRLLHLNVVKYISCSTDHFFLIGLYLFHLVFVFSREILNGIAVTDENGNKLGHSTVSSQHTWQGVF